MDDPDFGSMRHNSIDAWDCRIKFGDFPHPNARTFAIHIWTGKDAPTERQRQAIRELKARYLQLWPQIARGIIGVHESLKSADQLNSAVSEFISVHLGEYSEDSIEIVYSLDLPTEGSRGYFVRLADWAVDEVVVAE